MTTKNIKIADGKENLYIYIYISRNYKQLVSTDGKSHWVVLQYGAT